MFKDKLQRFQAVLGFDATDCLAAIYYAILKKEVHPDTDLNDQFFGIYLVYILRANGLPCAFGHAPGKRKLKFAFEAVTKYVLKKTPVIKLK